jgi:nicotinamidase-related amidase
MHRRHYCSAICRHVGRRALRAHGTEPLVLAGIATGGVVLSTVRHAADADYRLVVIEDCCADRDAEVDRILMERVFGRQAAVMTAAEVIGSLTRSA